MKTVYEFETAFEELLDDALNMLSSEQFNVLLDGIDMMLADYEDKKGE